MKTIRNNMVDRTFYAAFGTEHPRHALTHLTIAPGDSIEITDELWEDVVGVLQESGQQPQTYELEVVDA